MLEGWGLDTLDALDALGAIDAIDAIDTIDTIDAIDAIDILEKSLYTNAAGLLAWRHGVVGGVLQCCSIKLMMFVTSVMLMSPSSLKSALLTLNFPISFCRI